jgi:hypothetical protein
VDVCSRFSGVGWRIADKSISALNSIIAHNCCRLILRGNNAPGMFSFERVAHGSDKLLSSKTVDDERLRKRHIVTAARYDSRWFTPFNRQCARC